MVDLITWLGYIFPALLIVFVLYLFVILRRAASRQGSALQELEESRALSRRNNEIFEEMLALQRESRDLLHQVVERLTK